ncbi:MAG: twin-arginine translocase TatA/TatE family subunit [Gemmatimonadota bacterium]|nr:twin-arginine translocase TatA/TatE family subunit [Gemmatimonadota bacterium]
MFENLSLPHILMVLMIVMLLFGAKRIPEIAGSMGKGIKEFKRNINDATREETSSPARGGPSRLTSPNDRYSNDRFTQAELDQQREADRQIGEGKRLGETS